MDKVLVVCDELIGFVGVCCLVCSEGICILIFKSVKKKLKFKGFVVSVECVEVYVGFELLGVEFIDYI